MYIEKIREFFSEFLKRKLGLIGLGLLIFYIILSILAPITAPLGLNEWALKDKWKDNPMLVPPEWFMYITNQPFAPTLDMNNYNYDEKNMGSLIYYNLSSSIKYDYSGLPTGLIIYINAEYYKKDQGIISRLIIKRPDGEIIKYDITLYNSSQLRITDLDLRKTLYDWLSLKLGEEYMKSQGIITSDNLLSAHIPFSKLEKGILRPSTAEVLKGNYNFELIIISDSIVKIKEYEIKIIGNTHGLMGTDGNKRDFWLGIVWGAPVALMIGFLTSLISVIIGIIYGTISGYIGGKVDELMMRIVDVLLALPVFPILILLLVIAGPNRSIWIIIFLISVFGWMGLARVARSITLQLKETAFIESIRALGASSSRIIFRHIIPQMMPYAYANLALGVPGAILTEAGLSYLGLGDPTLPTWGQLLRHAVEVAAVQNGYWWLWITPGLLIAGVSIAFVFIGHSIDEILNPRIRRL
jgi:ABC-type dipeptide/oligopeptide/nickel transport systems, permease components